MYYNQTIAAIATPLGEGGIAVIRLSGEGAIEIADKVFSPKSGKGLSQRESHTLTYGRVIRQGDGSAIDECLAAVMKAPRSYTKEDVVEFSCHGSVASARDVLKELLLAGARLAGPGEFTKRAFLNGRMDLAQAEAVIDIITSKTEGALQAAVNQLQGRLSKNIDKLRDSLIRLYAGIQAEADFPEEGISGITTEQLIEQLSEIIEELEKLIASAGVGKQLREGVKTVITGKPNVGKSSILNALLEEERAIVTEIPGTTRDIIEEYFNIGGVTLRLLDTAGIRATKDIAEQMGVKRARELLNEAELVLFVLDRQSGIEAQDLEIAELIKDKNVIIVVNKSDINKQIDLSAVKELMPDKPVIEVSALLSSGIEGLKQLIGDMYREGNLHLRQDAILTNVRHMAAAQQAMAALTDALTAANAHLPMDLLFIDIQLAIEALGEITGLSVSEELVDRIFSEFCVGK